MKNLIIIRGLPGSGKSTLAKRLRSLEIPDHWEADMFFVRDGKYEFNAMNIGEAHEWCQEQTRNSLLSGRSTIVSNTFTTKREIEPYLEIAKETGATVSVILCQNNYGSIHNVPEETMKRMKKRFEYEM